MPERPLRRTEHLLQKYEDLFNEVRTLRNREALKDAEMTEKVKLLSDAQIRLALAEQEREGFRNELCQVWADANHNNRVTERNNRPQFHDDEEYMSLKTALQTVRQFNGENDLDAFLISCKTAQKMVHPNKQDKLLEYIIGSKLNGKALLQMKRKIVNTFDDLEKELEALFGKPKSLLGLQVEFNRLQQKDNEDVTKFATRAEQVTMDLIESIQKMNTHWNDNEKKGAEGAIYTLAKVNFEQGLKGQLQILVRAEKYTTLHEACIGAIGLERTISTNPGANKGKTSGNFKHSLGGNKQQSMGRQTIHPTSCFNCGQSGHMAKDCNSRISHGGQRKITLPVASDRRSIHAYGPVCKYCNLSGHEAINCKKLKRKLGIPDSSKLNFDGIKTPENKQVNNNTNNNTKKKNNNESNENTSLPVGAFQILMMEPTESENFVADKKKIVKKVIKAAEPSQIKNRVYLSADELKQPTMFLADSGAMTSVIKLEKLKEDAEIQKGTQILRGIANQDVTTLGKIILYLKVGNEELGHSFNVVPNNFPCVGGILGEDFLESPDLEITTDPGKSLVINGTHLSLYTAHKPFKMKARTETLTWVKTCSLSQGVVHKRQLKKGIFLGGCLTKPIDGKAIVCIINTTDKDEYLNIPNVKLEEIPTSNIMMTQLDKQQISMKNRIKLLHENLRLEHLNKEEKNSLLEILEEYNNIVQLPGDSPGVTNHIEHTIPTKSEAQPVNIRPHRLAHSQKDEVDRQVKEMLHNGVVRPSKSQWNAPLLIVPKKADASGKIKFRVVVDFRRLNDITIGDSFPLPNITEILDQLGNAKYFSTLDLASGFHQIPVKEEDKCKTAFSTPFGHYEFNRLPFGVKGGPATFQRLMNSVLAGIQGLRCFVYLDDIVVFGCNLEEHNARLKEVLERLRSANLRLQPDKCNFLRKEVVYLGHVITEKGIKADPSKIEAVTEFPVPENPKKIMSFLGLAGYYRKFIKEFSKIAKPLTELLKKDVTWKWTEKEQFSFEELKEKLVNAPILQYPDFEKQFILTTDASNKALGAILSQGEIGKDLPIAYASRTLNKAEQNYSTTEKELLAIVWGVKHFRPYLYGKKFTIVTDHRPLKWIFNIKDPGSRLMHWRIKLEEYEYEVVHKAGKLNTNADALSRINVITRAQQKKQESEVTEKQIKDKEVITPTGDEIITILKEYHDTPLGGHPGIQRMYDRIKLKYFWKRMRNDIENYIAVCKKCQLNKLGKTTKVPMVISDVPETAFEQCAMDIVGPLTETDCGNKYILTFQDALTKFSKAIAIPDQEANTIARAFVEKIICEHGTPIKLLTDQGKNFVGEIFKNVCKLLRIKKIQTTAYHPQTNGALERSHRTLAEYLRNFIVEDQNDWDTWLPYAMFMYNTTPHTATKITPFKLLYGRQAELPTSLKQMPRTTYSYKDYAQELRERLRATHLIAKEKLDNAKQSAKKQYDKDAKEISFKIGDKVLLKNEIVRRGRSKKLTSPWIGPYEIIEKNSDVNYTIRSGKKNKLVRVHINRLQPFIDL